MAARTRGRRRLMNISRLLPLWVLERGLRTRSAGSSSGWDERTAKRGTLRPGRQDPEPEMRLAAHRRRGGNAEAPRYNSDLELDAAQMRELSQAFAAPRWLKDLGRTSWLIVGAFAVVVGVIWLIGA